MKILIAPDSFKSSLSSLQATGIMEKAVRKVFPEAKTSVFPLADGGEGTVDVLKNIVGGEVKKVKTIDPLGREITAKWLKKDTTAFLEMAECAGLTLLKDSEKDPAETTTYGLGKIIRTAVKQGCRKIYIGIGGSATNDGGIGVLSSLGVKFFRKDGSLITHGKGNDLQEIKSVNCKKIPQELLNCKFIFLSDVQNPLYGRDGAAFVYGPQKGADEKTMILLDKGLRNYAKVIEKTRGKDISKIQGSGAAGGIAAGFCAFLDARIISGIETILKMGSFTEKLKNADILITGEGKIDSQIKFGKTLGVLFKLAGQYKIPVFAFAGRIERNSLRYLAKSGISLYSIVSEGISQKNAMENAELYLTSAVKQVMESYKANLER
jgi:glycerate 2-kinase